LFKNKKINVIWNSKVVDVIGTENPKTVTGIKLQNTKDGTESNLDLDGLFIAIGHDPATKLFKDQVDMDTEGYIITEPDSTATNIPGVYAAGDVKDKTYRQAVTAAGMGCMAALEAEKFIAASE
jgi:thioredoxin reductase (NADPH)